MRQRSSRRASAELDGRDGGEPRAAAPVAPRAPRSQGPLQGASPSAPRSGRHQRRWRSPPQGARRAGRCVDRRRVREPQTFPPLASNRRAAERGDHADAARSLHRSPRRYLEGCATLAQCPHVPSLQTRSPPRAPRAESVRSAPPLLAPAQRVVALTPSGLQRRDRDRRVHPVAWRVTPLAPPQPPPPPLRSSPRRSRCHSAHRDLPSTDKRSGDQCHLRS